MVPSLTITSHQSVVLFCCLCWIVSTSIQTHTVNLSDSISKEKEPTESAPWWVVSRPSQRQKRPKVTTESSCKVNCDLSYISYNPTSSKFEDKILTSSSSSVNSTSPTSSIADGPMGLEGAGGDQPLALSFSLLQS